MSKNNHYKFFGLKPELANDKAQTYSRKDSASAQTSKMNPSSTQVVQSRQAQFLSQR